MKKIFYGFIGLIAMLSGLVLYVGGLVIYVYTIILSAGYHGIIGACITTCTPIMSQIFYLFVVAGKLDTFMNSYTLMIVAYLINIVILVGSGFIMAGKEDS